jgi:hypothetical protein
MWGGDILVSVQWTKISISDLCESEKKNIYIYFLNVFDVMICTMSSISSVHMQVIAFLIM